MMRRSAFAGVVLMVAGIGGYLWMATRILVPVDMPVTFKGGHFRTGPFPINLRSTYWISLGWDWRRYTSNCSGPVRWILYTGGRVAARSDSVEYLDEFRVGSGIYDLDLEFLSDASCQGSSHPRLEISADSSAYAGYAPVLLWLSLICAGVGASLVVIAASDRFRKSPGAVADLAYGGTGGGRYRLVPRVARRRTPVGIPSFGLVAGSIYMFVMLTMMFSNPGYFTLPVD